MIETARGHVLEALEARGQQTTESAVYVAEHLDEARRDQIVLEYVFAVQRVLLRRPHADDPRQGWLALPEWQHVPPEVATESLDELRARIARLERKIQHYNYARRSPEKLKADKAELRELKRIERRTLPLFAGVPELDVNGAMLALEERMEKPTSKRSLKANSVRWGRTKNQ